MQLQQQLAVQARAEAATIVALDNDVKHRLSVDHTHWAAVQVQDVDMSA